MVRYVRKQAVLAKIETAYGEDAVPTAAGAMLMTNVTFKPSAEEVGRDLIKQYMGHQGVQLVGCYMTLSGEIEVAGAGVAGDLPGYAPMLRMCGFAATQTVGTKVDFLPVSDAFDSGTIYYNLDGVNHVMLGVRGNVKMSLKAKGIPKFSFEMKGIWGTIEAAALPAATYGDFADPVPVSKANTTFELHGYSGGVESIDLDAGAQIEPRLIINHESMQYVDRQATGSVMLDAPGASGVNFFSRARSHLVDAMALTHGVTAGNIVQVSCPAVQLKLPEYGDSQKIVTQSIGLILKPNTGNDELKITVK